MSGAPFLPRGVERGLESLLGWAGRRGGIAGTARRLLAPHWRRVARELAGRYRQRLAPLTGPVLARDPEALTRFDGLVAEAVGALRARRPPVPLGPLGWLDRCLYRDGEEFLDDPAFPEAERVRILAVLDWMNVHLGSYGSWIEAVEDLVAEAERRGFRPAQVWDLAAGHGGFALALKERLGARVEVTASDIKEEYLALGRKAAQERGLPVRFVAQDATDLANLEGAGIDLFLCTQSLHHFPPGMVARLLGEAVRVARIGVCFLDAERAYLPIAFMAPIFALYGRSWPMVHDLVVSLRRMYTEEELWLLAELAPGLPEGAIVDSGRRAPGFAFVRVVLATGDGRRRDGPGAR
jgi:ubiquinone/menaquinone biosynthesis C-methylase UbiE